MNRTEKTQHVTMSGHKSILAQEARFRPGILTASELGAGKYKDKPLTTPYIEDAQYKTRIAEVLGKHSRVQVTDTDVSAYRAREHELMEREFDAWVLDSVNNSTADRKEVQRLMPHLFQRRLEQFQHEAKIKQDVASIDINGPTTVEDLELLFAIRKAQQGLGPNGGPVKLADVAATLIEMRRPLFDGGANTYDAEGGTPVRDKLFTRDDASNSGEGKLPQTSAPAELRRKHRIVQSQRVGEGEGE